jgi:hypothetical protein
MGGDSNNVELVLEDQSQGYFGNTMGRREWNKWNEFLMNLGLMDAWNLEEFKRIGNKNFTWYMRFPTLMYQMKVFCNFF